MALYLHYCGHVEVAVRGGCRGVGCGRGSALFFSALRVT